MSEPRVALRLPDGQVLEVGPEAVVGRSQAAEVRLADPRVSTVHAEISWRACGFVILARGGRVVVDGVPVPEAPLLPGARIVLVPGVAVEVVRVVSGEAPVIPRTAGREWLRWVCEGDLVRVHGGDEPEPRLEVDGLPGRLLVALLEAVEPRPWHELAAALWPDEGELRSRRDPSAADRWTAIDERRFRNRFDQVLAALRERLQRLPQERPVVLKQGALSLASGLQDRVERAAPARRA